MKRINAAKIIDIVIVIVFIVNVLLSGLIVFRANNSIMSIYNILFIGIIILNSIFLLVMSVCRKKAFALINLIIIILIAIIGWLRRPMISDDEIWSYRNKIVSEIEANKFEVKDGVVNLPDEVIYEKVSDTKRVVLAIDGDRPVIYFYKNAGLLEDSCGYIYYSDKIDPKICKDTTEFTNKKHIEGDWYYCSTR